MRVLDVTIKWADDGLKENVMVAVGHSELTLPSYLDDDDIFFYFEDEGELEDYKYPGNDFRIVNTN